MFAPFFYVVPVYAVTVVDSASTHQIAQEQQYQQQQQAVNAANSELFNQVQMLQEEVMRTRGMIEELQFQVQELKQQRLDDYKSLDKRIGEIGQNATSVKSESAIPENTMTPDSANGGLDEPENQQAISGSAPAMPNEAVEYQKAYELIKQRKFEQSREAFIAFISKYPAGKYEPNAHYWLGELYIIEGNYLKAKSEFQVILKKYPEHSKHSEALYKVATVNYELGDRTTAKLQLQQLIELYGNKPNNAVTKAREFLQANFP